MKAETVKAGAGAALVITGWAMLAGLLIGVLWSAIAPRGEGVVRGNAVVLDPLSTGAFIGADGWFAVLGAIAGLGLALAAHLRFASQPVGSLIGLAVGGVIGAVVAWRTGHWLGPAPVSEQARALQSIGPGTRLATPVDLRARGVLLFWPIVAVTGYALLAAVRDRPTREQAAPAAAQPDTIGAEAAREDG